MKYRNHSGIKHIFKQDHTTGVSKFRIYLLRFFYLLITVLLGSEVWTELITHKERWQPLPAVAYSFWGAFSILAILGIVRPLKMIPLLLVQFIYKLIWVIIVAFPLWYSNQLAGSAAQEMTSTMTKGVLIDLFIIPWPYVLKNYVLLSKKNK